MQVDLRLYDISGGLARTMSQSLLGKFLEGIWHSGIVINDIEYFYGGGICRQPAGAFLSGTPTKTIALGVTYKTQYEFEAFLQEITSKYTLEAYHLLYHNCNHFTNECSMFLLGFGTPEEVRNLSEEILATPFGQSIMPFINGIMQTKNSNVAPLVDPYQNYVSHSDMFEGFVEILDEGMLKEFAKNNGIVVMWRPDDEVFLTTWVEKLISNQVNIGFIDCLRYPHLSNGITPLLQLYLQGECIFQTSDISCYDQALELM